MRPETKKRMGRALGVLVVVGLVASVSVDVEAKKKRRRGKKAKVTKMTAGGPTLKYEQFRKKIEIKVAEKREEQITGIKRLLEMTTEERDTPDLKFRLAELYYEKSRFYFFRGQEAEDRALRSNNEGEKADAMSEKKRNLAESKVWLNNALDVYREIRDKYPKYERTPEVLFALGQSYWSEGRYEDSIAMYRDLIVNFADSPLVAEAWIAFGEFYFNEGDVNRALKSYEKAAKDKRSRVYGFALYKQAWCYYNLADWRAALKKFRATVLYSQLADQLSGENKIALGREAQKDWVRAYSHVGDPKRAKFELADLLGVKDCTDRSCWKLLEQLAGLWHDEGYFAEAAIIYKQLMQLDPNNTRNPFFQGRIVDLVARGGNKKKVIRETRELVKVYETVKASVAQRTGTSQADEQARDDVKEAAQLAENTIRKLAQLWNREAKKTRTNKTYEFAKTMYEDYLGLFPKTNYAYEMRFQLADLYYKLEKFDDAAKAYKETVLAKPKDGKYLIEAANDNILAVEEHLKDLGVRKPKSTDKKVDIHPQKMRLIEACERYAQYVPADKADKLVAVRFKVAKIYYDYAHNVEALKRFDELVRAHPKSEQAEYAANLVVDIHNLEENWEELYKASAAYLGIADLIDGRDKLRDDLSRFSEYAKFKLVQILEERVKKERGDLRLVAAAYEDFYREFPKSENADKALFNASVAYDKTGEKEKADALRKTLLDEFPKSPLGADVAFYVAKTHEERTEFASAAKAFLSFARSHEDDARARDALFNAAVFYAGVGEVRTATKLREEYLKKYGRAKDGEKEAAEIYWSIAQDLDRAGRHRQAADRYRDYAKEFGRTERFWDALWREAEIRNDHLRQRSRAEKIKRDILGTYKAHRRRGKRVPPAAKRYASQVAFEIVDDEFSKYDRLRIKTPSLRNAKPFQRSLQDKAQARERLVKSYTKIVTEYQQAESSIASLFRIAEAWDEFVETLTAVPCPRGLTEDQCLIVKGEIETKAGPARDAAYQAYKTCVQKSNELNTFTPYSTRCVKALEKLAPDAYPQIVERSMSYSEPTKLRSLESNNLILEYDGYSVARQAQANAGGAK